MFPDFFPVSEVVGKIVSGLNFDGKVKVMDFIVLDGTIGVDNQIFRVLGCIKNYRTGGLFYNYETNYFKMFLSSCVLIELIDVDSLVNDDDVTFIMYCGLDFLLALS